MNYPGNAYNEDSLLWDKFLSGDKEAYRQIYHLYVHSLVLYGLRFTTDKEMVKDCVQDVFVKLHQNRKKLSRTDNIRLYLYVSLRNHLLNRFKQEHTHTYYITEQAEREEPFEESTVEDQLICREEELQKQLVMNDLLTTLPPRQREVLEYRYIDCLKISEISELMEMNAQSVQNLLQRSLTNLRKKIKR